MNCYKSCSNELIHAFMVRDDALDAMPNVYKFIAKKLVSEFFYIFSLIELCTQ